MKINQLVKNLISMNQVENTKKNNYKKQSLQLNNLHMTSNKIT